MTAGGQRDLFDTGADAVLGPHVFTIAPGSAFIPTLAEALLSGRLIAGFDPSTEPLGLARATVFLPTRRGARMLAAYLAEHAPKGGRTGMGALFLPRIIPLGDVSGEWNDGDSDEPATDGESADAADSFDAFGSGTMPERASGPLPPIPPTERALILTRLVLGWARSVDRSLLRLGPSEPLLVPASPADALALARDLERLMDALTTQGVDWHALAGVVEARHSAYFSITLAFLRIVTETWPHILAERGASDPVERRHTLLLSEAARLRGAPGMNPSHLARGPVIAAGSTGSAPATAALLAAISRLPQGAVVLPGLDLDLDQPSFDLLTRPNGPSGGRGPDETRFGHPQMMMARLLASIGIARSAVVPLGSVDLAARARSRVLSEALRPAATTELWAEPDHRPPLSEVAQALAGIAIVEAADEREEALAAAIAIREALEVPDATVALVTPDRGLAERVRADLARWNIVADDSAGVALGRTMPGRLARLVVDAAAADCAPRSLVALLTHPQTRFGFAADELRAAAAALEIGLLRGPEPPPGLNGLRAILPIRQTEAGTPHAARPLKRLSASDWALLTTLLSRLEACFGPLHAAAAADDLVALAAAHRQALHLVAAPPEADGALAAAAGLFEGAAGEALAALFDELDAAACVVPGSLRDYPAFFAGLADSRMVRSETGGGTEVHLRAHPRVRILGLLEARLISADRVVAGGLDEGVWPPVTRTDAFLNRPMAAALGLDPPERRIGQTAHDFVAALGIRDAVITRAAKRGGAPTVPSRFLQRLKALTDRHDEASPDGAATPWRAALERGRRLVNLAHLVDATPAEPRASEAARRPAPRPPLDLIPRSLSVTEVETLVRDPYAIFARHVLGLDPLDPLALPPGASDRGSIIHAVLGRFAELVPGPLPPDAAPRILALGREAFAGLAAYPDIAAQWWPRFERIALAFLRWEAERRPGLAAIHPEVSGQLALALAGGHAFTLRARADRIEQRQSGAFTIIDFKTGQLPSSKEVFVGFAPQLTLEAAMLKRGAFRATPASHDAAELIYIQASGGAQPFRPVPLKPGRDETRSVAMLVDEHLARFETLMARYLNGDAAFRARPFPKYAKRYNPYDHLARVREWSLADSDGEGEEMP